MLRKPAIIFASLLLAGGLVMGLTRLFELRFDRGDVYPPYSTLRSDPLGASVFYESLQRMPGFSAHRYFEQTLKQDDGKERALFVLGLPAGAPVSMSRTEFVTLQQFVFSGGRVVISYLPSVAKTWSVREQEKEQAKSGQAKPEKPRESKTKDQKQPPEAGPPGETRDILNFVELGKEWGFKTSFRDSTPKGEGPVEFSLAKRAVWSGDLPSVTPIHTALYFSDLTNGWMTVYERENSPVVAERRLGNGSVVLVADSYCLSNEAMFKERETRLPAWLMGRGHEAIFDEAHLGVMVDPGVASLMRKYRLHGLIFSLALLAALFIWKNSLRLVPPHEDGSIPGGDPIVLGKDSISGFVNLLRRGIPRADILNLCIDEWKKAAGGRGGVSEAQRREIDKLVQRQRELPARQRTPVETYRAISGVLRKRKPDPIKQPLLP